MKVLLVDDEPGVLKALKYLVDWELLGFTAVDEAYGGREALRMMRESRYSLLITDIRMPGVSGLDLIRQVRDFSPIPTIVVSGFDDFGYVKECLKYGIKDYLLKPVTKEDLLRLLETVRDDAAREQTLNLQLFHGIQAMRDQTLRKWTNGAMRQTHAEEHFRLLEMSLRPSQHTACCVLAEMDFMDEEDPFRTDMEIQSRRFAVRNIMEEVIGANGCVYEQSESRFGIVLYGERGQLSVIPDVLPLAEKLSFCVAEYAKVSVTLGIGEIADPATQIVKSFYTAEKMLERKFFAGQNTVIWSGTFQEEGMKSGDLTVLQELPPILDAVAESDSFLVHLLLQKQMERFAGGGKTRVEVRSFVLDLFVRLFHMLLKEGHRAESVLDAEYGDYTTILEAKSLGQLFAYAEQKCRQAIELRESAKQPPPVKAVEAVKHIVSTEYSKNITLRTIAEQIYLNSAYLGQLFKANEGISFNDYLMRFRMEKAKQLLRSTELKAYEVAAEVGYRELDWFYKKFKEYAGVSTSEYRTSKGR